MYDWTEEQEIIFKTVTATNPDGSPKNTFIKIDAVAGASKTTVLVEIAKRFCKQKPSGIFKYLVFGNANSAEAKQRFGTTASCSTLHALAYQAVVKQYKLKLPIVNFISWKNTPIKYRGDYNNFIIATTIIDNFCNSNSLTFEDYIKVHAPTTSTKVQGIAKNILKALYNGEIQTTHSFYLKLYHMGIMSGNIKPELVDILAIDECGDLTTITIDIIDKYPAKQKIIVGDQKQAIFKFMGCINGFDYFKQKGVTLPLTQSFRVPEYIAVTIEKFCQDYIDPNMKFKGITNPKPDDGSIAIITRTNIQLIDEMIKLDNCNIPYKLVSSTKIRQIFKYPLFLAYTKPGIKQFDEELKHIQKDVDEWGQLDVNTRPTLHSYILQANQDNEQLSAAFKLYFKYGSNTIVNTHNKVSNHVKIDCNLTLTTAHSSKGLEFSTVKLANGMNMAIKDVILKISIDPEYNPTEEELTELLLYYVAVTRTTNKLENAIYLNYL